MNMFSLSQIFLLSLLTAYGVFEYCMGADFFESFGARLICYPEHQKGCNVDLIEAYPTVSRSYDKLTRATTHFYLFTKKNVDVPELIHKCAGGVPPNSNFNPKCRTEFFIPGFVSGVCNFAIYRELKNERLKCGCYNVILVDWMWGNGPDLIEAKKNWIIVRDQIAIVIRNLKRRYNLTAKAFILTGHSYGAHIAGLVGQIEEIAIINGLDPAGVVVTENTPKDERLDSDDAPCVYVAHCNAGQCLPNYFGVNFTCGTMDFFYNGGLYQESCIPQRYISYAKKDFIFATLSLYPAACNHFQCLQYYKASMCPENCENCENCEFIGVECNKYAYERGMCKSCGAQGEKCAIAGAYACDCQTSDRIGKSYYLDTGLYCPYCDNSTIDVGEYNCPAAKSLSSC